jgi:hypothetical protein
LDGRGKPIDVVARTLRLFAVADDAADDSVEARQREAASRLLVDLVLVEPGDYAISCCA